jgi:putative ABC transport system permease protein
VIGLSVGIAIFLAFSGYVRYQISFDKFYENGDRIYRINYFEYQEGQPVLQSARSHDRAALLVHEYVPQIEAVARVYNEKAYVFTEDVRIVDQDMLFADSSFFKVFPVKIISGSAENSLVPPKAVMISQSQAKAYYGDEDPMGKTIYFNERLPFTITGVFEDIPDNASVDFDFLLSWSTLWFYGWVERDGSFRAPWTFTYVRLKNNVDIKSVNEQLTRMANEHITTLEKRGHTARFELQPYEDLHTSASLSGEIKPGVSKSLLYALMSLAIFILVAAWINYVNLSVARSLERADEIGVRKVFGASQAIISGQFLMEAFILTFITFILGSGLYLLFTGPLSNVLFTNIVFQPMNVISFVQYLLGFMIVTALVAFYPAQLMARFKPVLILKNKLGGKGRSNILQQSLIIFQLFLAVAVIGITLIAGRQLKYMREFDSGFNVHNTIALSAPASTNSDSLRSSRYRAFRNEVLRNSAFKSGTATMNIPGQEIRFHDEAVHAVGSENLKKQSFWVMWADEGYIETFGISLLAGRNFAEQEPDAVCLINETAAKALGYKNPVEAESGEIITQDQKKYKIVGVLKDYHHESLRKSIDPIIFFYRHPHEYGYYSFNVESRQGNYIQDLQEIWKKHYPNDTFNYHFMDNFFEEQYKSDELFSKLLRLFSVISIVVASLGLFGMTSLAIVKRTKEIAVRKVLGASVTNILLMISKNYVRLIGISCLFAFPLAYYLTQKWLEDFTNRISISWWMIMVPGVIVLATTLITIAGLSFRAAVANPAKSLKDQ